MVLPRILEVSADRRPETPFKVLVKIFFLRVKTTLSLAINICSLAVAVKYIKLKKKTLAHLKMQ